MRIPVTLNPADVMVRLRFNPAREGFENLSELAALAQELIQPRGIFEVSNVGRMEGRTIDVEGVTFLSPILRENLGKSNKVFPYIITVGAELERAAAAQNDLLRQYYLEEIANIALEQAADWFAKYLAERYGMTDLSNMSPGSLEDWPITEQAKLFSIFGDTEKLIGVRLTENMLMIPRKSVSGILFPSGEGFVACQLCEREKCPGRKAPYGSNA